MADAAAKPGKGDASITPIGPPSAEVYAVVPALRTKLAESLPPGTLLWGADLLDAEDAAGATVLGKCVAASRAARAGAVQPGLLSHLRGPTDALRRRRRTR